MRLKSAETVDHHGNSCEVCGNVAYSECSICGVYLNLMANRGESAGRTCFYDYHNGALFGLAFEDVGISKMKSEGWNYPSLAKNRSNASNINKLNDELSRH